MSKLKDLINKLCPNGVEFKRLSEITKMSAGDRVTKAEMSKDALYPVMGGGVVETGKYHVWNRENCVTISRAGSAGSVGWHSEKFWATDVCFTAEEKDKNIAIIKYVYYVIEAQEYELKRHLYGGTLPKLDKSFLWGLPIPVPPLPVQEEIVRILDKFTEYNACLARELELRKKQYSYYRDKLLTFGDEVPRVRLADVAVTLSSGKNKERNKDGAFPVYGSTGIIARTNTPVYDYQQILIARVGSCGYVQIADGQYDVTDNTLILDVKKEYSLKYFYYLLQSMRLNQYAKGGAQPLITGGELKKLEVPIPPLETQEKIVKILDKFESLCNDLVHGLPAEIEARRKQYEFYRDKLLNFESI